MTQNNRPSATVYHPPPMQTILHHQPMGNPAISQIQQPLVMSHSVNNINNTSTHHTTNPRHKTPTRSHNDTTTSPKKYNYLGNTNYDEEFENLSRKVKDMRK
jgi:hypothetical protein